MGQETLSSFTTQISKVCSNKNWLVLCFLSNDNLLRRSYNGIQSSIMLFYLLIVLICETISFTMLFTIINFEAPVIVRDILRRLSIMKVGTQCIGRV